MVTLTWYGRLRLHALVTFVNTAIAFILRINGLPRRGMLPKHANIRPTKTIFVPSSTDPTRSIAVNVFYPPGIAPGGATKLPVHLNAHGSGFCYNLFSFDSEFCAYVALNANCIVLDTDYAKAPRHPFPGGYQDVADVVEYIKRQPYSDWDISRFTLGGFSAGACLVLGVAAHQPKGTLKGVLTFYPPVDLSPHPEGNKQVPAIPKGNPGLKLSLWARTRFMEAYLPDDLDREDPRLSPIYAPAEAFPPITIICGDCDPLLPNVQRFVAKLHAARNDVEEMLIEGVGHGWERTVRKGDTKYEKLRDEALQFFVSRLQSSWA